MNTQIACVTPTDTITMHSRNLTIDTEKITAKPLDGSDSALAVSETEFETQDDFLKIKLSEQLKANQDYEVEIHFEGELQEEQFGFFKSSYFDEDAGAERWLAATYFMPDGARSVFPCFDEPALKAEFSISLGRSNKYSSVSNMPLAETEKM